MNKKSVLQQILDRIDTEIKKESARLKKEKDPVKQTEINLKIQRKIFKIVVEEIKTRSDSDFDNWLEDVYRPFTTQYSTVENQVDDIMLDISKNSKEFDSYKKIQSLKEKYLKSIFSELDDVDLSKKHLERYVVLLLLGSAQNELQVTQNAIEYNEFWRAITLVKRRLGFDHDWFTCLGLIQLHENLIKRKIIDLSGKIKGDEPINVLIINLAKLINEKENRDVTLDLEMSQGLKKIRDLMTHEGYLHKVTKNTLKKITKEIEDLEALLYQEKFSIFKE